ncbi:MAG: hypothetical protein ACFFC3_04490 [Candidatus Odinarchaeota archaeon]
MPTVRNYIWILPLIGSMITTISLFTPAAVYLSGLGTEFLFMDGFYIDFGGIMNPSFGFIHIPILLIIGIICLILILICIIIMFISSLTHRKKETPGSWLAIGIIFIGVAIFYIVGSHLGLLFYGLIRENISYNFWGNYVPSFAVIAPFIAGGISIVSFIIDKFTNTEDVEIKPISKEIPLVSEPISQPTVIKESQIIKFCPRCGYNLTN